MTQLFAPGALRLTRQPQRAAPAPKPLRAGYGPHTTVRPASRHPDGSPATFATYWHGQRSAATFASEGEARAFLASCDIAGKLRY